MDQSLLDLICCPVCHSPLSLGTENESKYLQCSTCDRQYPMQNGIVHFIDPQELEGSNQKFARSYDRFAPVLNIFKTCILAFWRGTKNTQGDLGILGLEGEAHYGSVDRKWG